MYGKILAIVKYARAADQRSMIGYGEMLLKAARQFGHEVVEFRPASLIGRLLSERAQGRMRKLANDLDRLLITPLKQVGRKADIVYVVDLGNTVYLPLIRHHRTIVTMHDMIPCLARDGGYRAGVPPAAGAGLWSGSPHSLRRLTASSASPTPRSAICTLL